MRLVVPTPSSKNGTIDVQILETTYYPGIAMNYPKGAENDNAPDLYFLAGEQPVMERKGIPFDPTGYTGIDLVVNDYAAWGRIRVTIALGKTKQFPPMEITIPRTDTANNRMPDHGWSALQDVDESTYAPIPNFPLVPSKDEDVNPAAAEVKTFGGSVKKQGLVGDGLSNIQEYRGFIVGGTHRRLNPFHKDLFVHISGEMNAFPTARLTFLALAKTLQLTRHLVRDTEVDSIGGGLAPVINRNRLGVPGGDTDQRAVFVRPRFVGPYRDVTKKYPAWGIYYGYQIQGKAFHDVEDLDVLQSEDDVPAVANGMSPNHTKVAEMYPKAFHQKMIRPGADGFLDSLENCFGEECDSVVTDEQYGEVIVPGDDLTIRTRCHPLDECVGEMTICGTPQTEEITNQQGEIFMGVTLAHELGHALNMFHLQDVINPFPQCKTVMSHSDTPPAESFIDIERKMIRVHENP